MKKKKPAKPDKVEFPVLSKAARPEAFCKCLRCRLLFTNDLGTMHAPCPKCGAVMENLSREAAENTKVAWDKEKA